MVIRARSLGPHFIFNATVNVTYPSLQVQMNCHAYCAVAPPTALLNPAFSLRVPVEEPKRFGLNFFRISAEEGETQGKFLHHEEELLLTPIAHFEMIYEVRSLLKHVQVK